MPLDLYRHVAAPLLGRMDPEQAHRVAILAAQLPLIPLFTPQPQPELAVSLWNRTFPNPIGLAAGFDKNGKVADAMLRMGFGFVEIGGVTPRPQDGNPKPRLFRLPEDGAIINRMGFNNDGMHVVSQRLARLRNSKRTLHGLIGVNLGKNKDTTDPADDYVKGARAFAGLADFLVINVSSPNTPGLRALQERKHLEHIVSSVRRTLEQDTNSTPLLLKIAPDLGEQDEAELAALACDSGIDGLVVANTTLARPDTLTEQARHEAGGLSGRPLRTASTALLRRMYHLTGGSIPLIGVGGIGSGADAWEKIKAGASLIQLYTALVYQGPSLVQQIRDDLVLLAKREGFHSVAEAIGADHNS
ncbi:quinone-dependent dihydroorotate dehydrogenase [Haematospirillum sp. H1815]|uniref:quinone-dependent dihydroorotate dehydrogenase n=1 Tax=Haematospirillum sp. H1815 TaxID=2723108 RepID=UPI001439D120|nr:quinone-dependent dihydroorotate dehydrogenase [Haematospirillum sp. H1815]NKD77709.1 quinone-dependent dihydroorotate dehydrogenase [Haematospirillum sp. H1815]